MADAIQFNLNHQQPVNLPDDYQAPLPLALQSNSDCGACAKGCLQIMKVALAIICFPFTLIYYGIRWILQRLICSSAYNEDRGWFINERNGLLKDPRMQLVYCHTYDGVKLNGMFFRNPEAPKKVILFIGGMGSAYERASYWKE